MAQPAYTPATLPTTDSLQVELAKATAKKAPLMVMVSLEGCPFCKVARENYLGPLREQQGLLVFQVDMRSKRPIKNFTGLTLTQDELIRSWGVNFYGAYLDERLQQASAAMRR